ncbi:hypothetical protein CCYA_CCYA03G0989 [Cyanidiococcus yangmingshanensis]|nr:hypothetical protein CCYA_CCYA03G0989 [Cyanidiococcus yangmingshanensis]
MMQASGTCLPIEAVGGGTSDELDERAEVDVTRPSIYPQSHRPQPRGVPLSLVDERDLLNELKTSRLEGFYNLSFLLLGFALFYMTVRSIIEKGFLVDFGSILLRCPAFLSDVLFVLRFSAALWAYSLVFYVLVWATMARRRYGHSGWVRRLRIVVAVSFYIVAQGTLYVVSTRVLWRRPTTPALGGFLTLWVITISLKGHSYFLTNWHLAEEAERTWRERARRKKDSSPNGHVELPSGEGLRSAAPVDPSDTVTAPKGSESPSEASGARLSDSDRSLKRELSESSDLSSTMSVGFSRAARQNRLRGFPANVNWSNFVYFMAAPTLVYETEYPRTERVRYRYVASMFGIALLCIVAQVAIMQQFMLPVLQGQSAGYSLAYHAAKLAIPSIIFWLLGFLWFFHCALSAWAEMLRFADRQFYQDWWNATTLESFWNKWNMLVHEWALRHVFIELQYRSKRVSKAAAGFATFLVSAVLHEYLFAVAFKTISVGIFLGMMIQVPGIWLTRHSCFRGRRRGNLLMWLMLFLGHPLGELLYFRAYFRKHNSFFCHD